MAILSAEVAEWLLSNGYHLAAFELMLELQEGGDESDVLVTLSKFFQDERRFPAEALANYEDADGKGNWDCVRMCLSSLIQYRFLTGFKSEYVGATLFE